MKNFNGLSSSEKDCLIRILEIQKDLPFLTLREVSEKVMYSHATVNRLIKKGGFKDYKEFKNSFRLKGFESGVSSPLEYSEVLFSSYEMNKIVQWIVKARVIHLVGMSNDAFAISEFGRGLVDCGNKVDVHLDLEYVSYSINTLVDESDLVILFTIEENANLYESLLQSLDDNKTVVMVTPNRNSSICKLVDLVLFSNNVVSKNVLSNYISQISAVACILECLVQYEERDDSFILHDEYLEEKDFA